MKLVPEAYTIAAISKLLDIPTNTLRTWEQFLQGVLIIPRDQKGNRYYTDVELEMIKAVKSMRDIGVSFEVIREKLSSGELEVAVTSDIQRTSREEIISKQFFDELANHIRNQVTNELRAELEESREKITRLEKEIESTRNLVGSTSEDISKRIEDTRKQVATSSEELVNKLDSFINETRAERIKREEEQQNKSFLQRLFNK